MLLIVGYYYSAIIIIIIISVVMISTIIIIIITSNLILVVLVLFRDCSGTRLALLRGSWSTPWDVRVLDSTRAGWAGCGYILYNGPGPRGPGRLLMRTAALAQEGRAGCCSLIVSWLSRLFTTWNRYTGTLGSVSCCFCLVGSGTTACAAFLLDGGLFGVAVGTFCWLHN